MAEEGFCQARRGLGGATVSILQPSHQTECHCQTWVRNEDPHDQALNEAREVHRRALEAAHLLEQNIEGLSWAASGAKSAKCQCPYSCSHSSGRPQGRHAQSPSPHRLKRHVTFLDQEEEMSSGEGPRENSGGRQWEEERWKRVTWALHPP